MEGWNDGRMECRNGWIRRQVRGVVSSDLISLYSPQVSLPASARRSLSSFHSPSETKPSSRTRSLREIGGGRKGCAAHLGYQTVELRFRERIRNSIRGDGQLVAALPRLEAFVGHHTGSVWAVISGSIINIFPGVLEKFEAAGAPPLLPTFHLSIVPPHSSSTIPCSSHRCSPCNTSCATRYAATSALRHSCLNLASTRPRASLQNKSAR